ncbi:hypothetical protein M408DRAFT_184445 [Serendipita vermifera MAFF 305830]|uniref:Uncharacterized protein n=1 Tax=Serendipita vermifera MAFF 305830 TaxID=933852 RepID=A0A0C3BMJ4_SERVB|nr:hypothetical protein M408DRAFT_184445 [Serendipita vermifera MAFF 305830]
MWMPIFSGIMHSGAYAQRYVGYPFLIPILQDVIGYAECGVLITLFAFYVRQRKAHQRDARAAALKVGSDESLGSSTLANKEMNQV